MTTPKKLSLGAGNQMKPTTPAKLPASEPPPPMPRSNAGPEAMTSSVKPRPEIAHEKKDFSGRKPSAVETITLRGVSPEPPVCNEYPYDELKSGDPVYLVRDPFGGVVIHTKVSSVATEPHSDPTAISVQDAPEGEGRHIGYIPKTLAATITKGLDAGYEYEAEVQNIKGGFVGHGGEKLNHGVDILVKFYPPAQP